MIAPGWPATLSEGSVVLRPYRRGDGPEWSRIRRANQAWLAPWEPTVPGGDWHAHNSPARYRGILRDMRMSGREGTAMPFAICYDGHLVGQITLGGIVRRAFCSAYAGYWVDRGVAGRGITPTALALAVDHAFQRGALHRIEVNVRPENVASRRVVEKLGFREESFHRRYLHIDGDWRDHIGYALTVEDLVDEGGLLARLKRLRDGAGR